MTKRFSAALDALKADVIESVGKIDAKCTALADSVSELKKADTPDGNEDTMAERVAADAVDPAAFAALASSVADMRKKQARPMKDQDAFADAQAKADTVMRALGTRAEPPMAGEDLVNYKIRMHRKMQPHSLKWKGVELSLIAADHQALDNVLGEIRADAMEASMSPVGLPPGDPLFATAGAHEWLRSPDESLDDFADRARAAALELKELLMVIGGLPQTRAQQDTAMAAYDAWLLTADGVPPCELPRGPPR